MRELARRKRARVVAMAALVVTMAAGVALGATLRDGGPGATAQTTATAETPATVLPANPPTCTAKALGVSRASNPGLAADCDTLLAIQSTLRVSGWINYDAPSWWDHSYALNWLAIAPLKHWRGVTLGGTPQRVVGLDFSDTRESVKVFNARTRQWEASQPFTREWTLRGVIPTQLGNLTALETLDLGGSELTGVVPTHLGKLERLRTLDLSNNKLTGELPTVLDDLESLGRVRLAGNGFTGCAPAELWRITSHDLVTLGLPNCKPPLTYGAPSWTGIVDAPGEHAFFTNSGPALTYEGLRNDVVQVVIHKQDAGGVSRDAIYDDVEVGDDFEWREASDCWVRYLVERVMPDPTDMPLKVLAVKRYGYAYTGCSGQVSLTGSRTLTWIPPNIQNISAPIRYGPYQLYPHGWEGSREEIAVVETSGSTATSSGENQWPSQDLSEVQKHPLWGEPQLPNDWDLASVSGKEEWWVESWYSDEKGYLGAFIMITKPWWRPLEQNFVRTSNGRGHEARIIGGNPVILWYNSSRASEDIGPTSASLFDETSGIQYFVNIIGKSLRRNLEEVLEIARELASDKP